MPVIDAILLGILQGATEFLPVSSSGHLVLAQHLLEDFEQPGVLFEVLLHVGTMVAVMVYFRHDLVSLVSALWRTDASAQSQRRILFLLAAGSVPTAMIGLFFKDFFIGLFDRPDIVCVMLLVTGGLLCLAEWHRRKGTARSDLSLLDALVAGTVQGCAIIPGISRSGSTIAALLLRDIDGETAARFSFFLALPAVFGAALLSLKDLGQVADGTLLPYLAGTLAATLTGLVSIHLVMTVVQRRRLHWFAVYCLVVATAGLVIFF